MTAARLAKLLPVMRAQKDAAQQRMALILARENECLDGLRDLDAEEARQYQACQGDPAALDGLALWKIWVSGQRSRMNLQLAALRAERESHARTLAVLVGKLDVTKNTIAKMARRESAIQQRRQEDDAI